MAEKMAVCEPGSGSSPDTESSGASVSVFPAYRTMRSKCVLFKPFRVWYSVIVAQTDEVPVELDLSATFLALSTSSHSLSLLLACLCMLGRGSVTPFSQACVLVLSHCPWWREVPRRVTDCVCVCGGVPALTCQWAFMFFPGKQRQPARLAGLPSASLPGA